MVKTHTTTDFIPIQTGRGRKPLVARVSACRPAFTMNELMIAAAIIGIIAAITVPTLLADTNKKRYQVASDKVNLAIINALKSMRVEGNLVGHDTTENFVGELKKHMNINKICQQDELSGCFSENFKISGEDTALSEFTNASDLGKDWGTNLNGVVLNDGTQMLLAYNPYCSKFEPENCVAVFYDTKASGQSEYNGTNGVTDMGMYNAE